jgi:gliding motility-associated-like protein
MKKKYLLAAIFLNLLILNSFASSLKNNNTFNTITAVPTIQLNTSLSIVNSNLRNPGKSTVTVCEGDNLTLNANPNGGVAPYTFSWTGPNGFVSTVENPVINNINSSQAGDYIVNITDSSTTTFQNTVTVIVIEKIDPTFDATVFAICNGGFAPILSTTSTNGITGSWNPSVVSNTVTKTYVFTPNTGQCANNYSFTIYVINNVTPTFTLPNSICFNSTPPQLLNISNNGIVGNWSPSTVSNTKTESYTFTPVAGQCANTRTIQITVNPLSAIFTPAIPPICSGDALAPLPTTSTNGVTGTWSPAVNNTTTTYTFTPTPGQCATVTTSMTVVVNPIAATFTQVAPICSGATLNPLPTTSNNGVIGTWAPAINNTATTSYTFTPSSGQCTTTPASMTVVVNPLSATFTQVAPICSGAALSLLPTTSDNGVTGTWSPAINNTTTTTYTFTPTSGQCTTTTSSMRIVVNPTAATFTQVAPICSGENSSPLPTTSNNGVTGSWSPVMNNMATTTYTFNPTSGQCTTNPATMTIVVNQLVATFTQVAPICSGQILANLPTTSNNGITGTWAPAMNNTATTTYTFTPASGQCSTTPASMTIVINPISATFTQVAPICSGQTLVNLPTTSNNDVTGTWAPAMNNTATTAYTFTPTSGQCTTTTSSMTIVVNPIAATFTQVGQICSGATLANLPTTSNNGVTGTWAPAMNNSSTTSYTFTPASGQCTTSTVSMTIVVNPTVATFTQVAPICSGQTLANLPTTSNNGVTGTWSPAMNNTTTTAYTFTPASGQCTTTTASMTIVVNPVVAKFTQVAPICSGQTLANLPTNSNNGVTGTWAPAMNNTTTTTYTFTPTTGKCTTTPATMTIVVNPIVATFTQVAPICSGQTLANLPTTSNNGVNGSWSPAMNNSTTTTYTFTPASGQCTTSATTMTILVNPTSATFSQVAPICSGTVLYALPTTSNNGVTGTWSPSMNNTATTTYTFTPTAGQCTTTSTSMTIVVDPIVTTFIQVASICPGTTLSPLPTTSTNGVSGTWSPAMDNTQSTTYTFTPTTGQCTTSQSTMTIVVSATTATFSQVADICTGTAFALPNTSNNGVSGTWSPTLNFTATTLYAFTPTPGQCTITTTPMTVAVNQKATPTFSPIAPICSATVIPPLPTISQNGIPGTWSPAVNNTAATTYTFTPAINQCAFTTTMTITVFQSPTSFSVKTTDVVNNKPDGIIEISNPVSGLAPFQYSINDSSFSTNPIFTNLVSGIYNLTVKDSNGCEFKKGATINSICLFPNVITPNNDSYNNNFNLSGCEILSLQLFNRYGREVNNYSNYTNQWSGTNSKGEALPDGTYFYVAEIKGGTSKVGWVFVSR